MALQIDEVKIVIKGNVPKKFPNGTHTVLTFAPSQLSELEEGVAQAKALLANAVEVPEEGPLTQASTAIKEAGGIITKTTTPTGGSNA